MQAGFEPLVSGFVRVPLNDLDAVRHLAENNRNICAVMVEPIQGEGGINVSRLDYLRGLHALGVNRLSIGVQSFFEADLKFMNRSHTAEQAAQLFRQGRAALTYHFYSWFLLSFICYFYDQTREGTQLDKVVFLLDGAALALLAPTFLHFCANFQTDNANCGTCGRRPGWLTCSCRPPGRTARGPAAARAS